MTWSDDVGTAGSGGGEGAGAGAVAVVGMAGRFPGADGVEALWRRLRDGAECISRFTVEEAVADGLPRSRAEAPERVLAAGALEDPARFDAALFGLSPAEAERIDPQHRLLLETAWAALEDAGRAPGGGEGRVAVFAGAGQPSYLLDHVYPAFLAGPGDLASAYAVTLGNDKDFLATRLAYLLDLRGPALTVGTACSTSLVAACLAASALATGECDVALAGGATLRLPQRAGYPYQPDGILSPDGHCRPFDAAARGTVPGSGCGMVVLKRLEDAVADGDPVRAVLRGWAVNNDGGGKAGYTAPRVGGQEEVIREALALAGVDAATVGFVEGHGTATPLGDPIEVEALRRAFAAASRAPREAPCWLGSVKGNLGHLDAAAGVAGLIKAVLAVERGWVPPTLHFTEPNPRLGLGDGSFAVNREGRPWEGPGARRAGVSSFGIGGTNAHVVLEQAPQPAPRPAAAGPHLLVLSAATEAALDAARDRLAEHLEGSGGGPVPDLDDVAGTLQEGRRGLPWRRAVVVGGAADGGSGAVAAAARRLGSGDGWRAVTVGGAAASPSVAFLFPGQGAQHPGMGAELHRRLPVFRRAVDRCLEILEPIMAPHPGLDLAWALPPREPAPEDRAEASRRLAHTALAQPALFVVSWALAEVWESWGVVPEAFLGHSIGEFVAACRAGVLSLEDALDLVAARGLLMADLPRGSMLSVPLAAEPLARHLEAVSPELALAAINAPDRCVASGPPAAVDALARRLAAEGIEGRPLVTSHAFHSPVVEAVAEPFRERVARVRLSPPRIPFASNVTGTWITDAEATDAAYWARHLRAPVRFAAGVETVLGEAGRVLLEVGPGRALTTLVERHPAARGRVAVPSLPHPRDRRGDAAGEGAALLAAAGRLFTAGLEAPRATLEDRPRRRVPLPTYPFGGERHWIPAVHRGAEAPEPGESAGPPPSGAAAGGAVPGDAAAPPAAIPREPDPADWFYLPSWRRRPVPGGPPSPSRRPVLVVAGGPPADAVAHRLVAALEARGEVVESVAGDDVGAAVARVGTAAGSGAGDGDGAGDGADPAGPPVRVVWLGAVAGPPPVASGDGDAGSREGDGDAHGAVTATTFLDLARALAGSGTDVLLTAVSDALTEVGGEVARRPGRAAAAGLARVVPQELAGVACRWVDLPAAEACTDADVDALAAELAAVPASPAGDGAGAGAGEPAPAARPPALPPPLVAIRGGRVWEQRFERVRLPPPGDPDGPGPADAGFAAGGRYLLVGGAGRFGVLLAEHLLAGHGARVLLLDRAAPAADDLERLQAAAAHGGGTAAVEVRTGDAADPAVVTAALDDVAAAWGGLDGVVHAAGPPAGAYRPLAEVGRDDLALHLAAKASVAAALDAAVAAAAARRPELRPRFLLATSSLAPVLGGVGLGLHAAADGALDALAAQRSRSGAALPWLSLGWEVWDQPFAGAVGEALGPQQTALALNPEEVLDSAARAIALAGEGWALAASGDLPARVQQWARTVRRRPAAGAAGERDGGAPYRPPRDEVEERVAAIWEAVLGVPRVGIEDDFFLLGGDSLAGLQVLSRMRSELQVDLPLESFFEARTVAGMGAVIAVERRRGAEQEARMEAMLEEIEGLSDDEVEALLGEEGP